MNTAVINIRTDVEVKEKAKKVARDLGFSLSSLLNAYLKYLVKSKTVHFSLEEKPNAYLRKMLAESARDIKKGDLVSFDKAENALDYVENVAY